MAGENNIICIDWSSDEDLQEILLLTAAEAVSQPVVSQQQSSASQQQPVVTQRPQHLSHFNMQQRPAVLQQRPALLQRQQHLPNSSVPVVDLLSASEAGGSSSAAVQPKRLSDASVQEVVLLSSSEGGGASSAAVPLKKLANYPVPDGLSVMQRPRQHLLSVSQAGELFVSFVLALSPLSLFCSQSRTARE